MEWTYCELIVNSLVDHTQSMGLRLLGELRHNGVTEFAT